MGVLIETMEVMPEHVHLFVTSDPTRCVAEIVNRLKGVSSRLGSARVPTLGIQDADLVEPFVLRWHRGARFAIDG
jgi:REP element-mobilizing transposase RayT